MLKEIWMKVVWFEKKTLEKRRIGEEELVRENVRAEMEMLPYSQQVEWRDGRNFQKKFDVGFDVRHLLYQSDGGPHWD